jgi:hypothetical protein
VGDVERHIAEKLLPSLRRAIVDQLGDPTYADAILDRLVHNANRIELSGESLRRARAKGAKNALTENQNG